MFARMCGYFYDNVKDINLFLKKYKESFFNFIKEQAKKKIVLF